MDEFLFSNLYEHGNDTKKYIDFIPVKDNPWIIQNVHNIFEQITTETLAPSIGSSAVIMGLFCKFFCYLNSEENYTTIPVQIGTDAENKIYDMVTDAMIQTNGRISRQELSSLLHYSGVYLNNVVKKYTGLTLYDYGMTFCMNKAAELLTSTNSSISDIAVSLGFTNRTHFYKVFQRTFHTTPSNYRKKHMQHTTPDDGEN
ncbi:MAG: helix-turn-helix transcriptional regulator [Lachnospiraceae bacterium]|nr:helix-turn-helix transcriptional regulator [Lachnospiraceae bacterium]